MQLTVNGAQVFAATGGRTFDPSAPLIVFLHGGGMDHSVWALLARWFAHHGCSVLAPDMPGHGRSDGAPLTSIAAMAEWTAALIDAVGARSARLVGHSMGSLVALEFAAREPSRVVALGLVGSAAEMPVAPELLDAARANDHAAIDMVTIWGFGFAASLGGSLAPGAWMCGGGARLLERAKSGVLFADLNACNAYKDGLASAGKVKAPARIVLGERDLMTSPKRGRELAAAITGAQVIVLPASGHMLMQERPDALLAALRDLAST